MLADPAYPLARCAPCWRGGGAPAWHRRGGVGLGSFEKRDQTGCQAAPRPPACSMASHTADADAKPDSDSQKLLNVLPVSLRLRTRPWWFPIQEVSNPLVLYMEAWVAERVIGELTPGGSGLALCILLGAAKVWVSSLYSARGSKSMPHPSV